jgi:hypothetical protein
MKNRKMRFMSTIVFLFAAVIAAFAQEKSMEEKKLEAGAVELDKKYSEGQQRVADKIKDQFGVDDARLLGMRYKNMGYGEIAIALGLARGLHGGITDKNLYKIAALRQGPPVTGWGKIAEDLGLKLGPVIISVRKISAEVRKQEKLDEAEKDKRNEDKQGGESGKPVRPEKTAKAGMKLMTRE